MCILVVYISNHQSTEKLHSIEQDLVRILERFHYITPTDTAEYESTLYILSLAIVRSTFPSSRLRCLH
jgi:hypothetical protein